MTDLLEFLVASLEQFLEPQTTLVSYLWAHVDDLGSVLSTAFRVIAAITEVVFGANLLVNAVDNRTIPPIIGSVVEGLSASTAGCLVLIAIGLFLLLPVVVAVKAVGSAVVVLWSLVTAFVSGWVFVTGAFSLGRDMYYRIFPFVAACVASFFLAVLIRAGHIEVLFSSLIIALSGVSAYRKLTEIPEFSLPTCFSLAVLCIAFNLLAGYYLGYVLPPSSGLVVWLFSHSFWLLFAIGLGYEYFRDALVPRFRWWWSWGRHSGRYHRRK